ncbi:MAG TPA: outer membrane beta-barrel protein [Cyclobacteriaceae bacterium]|nr:outer membrane beta-barrel protein [Cyclobacteriaceae bacterium]
MKRIFVLALATLLSSPGFSQQVKFSFSAGVNMPFINDVIQPRVNPVISNSTGFTSTYSNTAYLDQKFETSPGLQGGFLAHYALNQKFSISAGVSATYFRYIQKLIVSSNNSQFILPGVQPSNPDPWWGTPVIIGTPIQTPGHIKFPINSPTPVGMPSDQGETQVTYLTLPATADYSFAKKWTASAGLNAHVIMAANVKRYAYTYTTTGGMILNAEDKTADGFTNVLLGAVSQIRYQVIKPLSIDLGYSYIFTPIYDQSFTSTASEKPARYMVLSLSARYWLK